jgi:hypothetical protein
MNLQWTPVKSILPGSLDVQFKYSLRHPNLPPVNALQPDFEFSIEN